MVGYIFGGDTGKSYADLKREREIADMLAAQALQGQRTGLPGAIEQIGKALIAKKKGAKVSAGEEAARNEARDAMMRLLGGGSAVPSVNYTLAGSNRDMASKPQGLNLDGVASGPLNPTPSDANYVAPEDMGSPSDFNAVFANVEQQYGLPSGYLSRTAQIESGGNPSAKNPNSSATGLFQFINSTAKQYGLSDPTDPMASTDAAARLAADNAAVLRRTLGREPTSAELYLAHQQGAGGAARLLGNPDARAADIVGADAVRLNGGSLDMTAGQFANKWLGKFDGGSGGAVQVAQAGGMGSMTDALAILDNPYASDAQRMIAGQIIQRQFAKPEGLTAWQAAQLDMKRQEMEMRRQGTWSGPQVVNNVGTTPEGGAYGQPVTPGQEQVDKKYADQYIEWTQGGGADAQKNIAQLEGVIGQLESGANLSGPGVGTAMSLPLVGPMVAPTATNAKEQVDEVIQRNLRVVLGAQFTAKEGEALIARAYNPKLDEATNAARLRRLLSAMKSAAEAKQEQADYFEKNGTLTGYRGKIWTMSDIDAAMDGKAPTAGPLSADDADLFKKYGLD